MSIQVIPSIQNMLQWGSCLRSYLSSNKYKRTYLVSGNNMGGKKTLIHYLMRKKLEADVSDDGQEVLTIVEEANKIIIVKGLLQLYPDEQNATLYIWLNGFTHEQMKINEQIQWALTFRYIAHLLLIFNCQVAFVLVFSLLEENLPLLMLNFKKNYGIFQNFIDRTAFILSKLADQSQLDEFTEMTSRDMIESDEQLGFLQKIVQSKKVFPFCCRDPEEQQVNTLNQNLKSLFTQNNNLQISLDAAGKPKINSLMWSCLTQNQENQCMMVKLLEDTKCRFIAGLETLNASLCLILFAAAKQKAPPVFLTNFQENATKISNGKQIKFLFSPQIFEHKEKKQKLFSFYEECRNQFAKNPSQFIIFFMKKLTTVEQFWSEESKETCCIQYIEHSWIALNNFEDKNIQIDNTMFQVFQNSNSFISDVVLSNIFENVKEYLSKQFIKNNEQALKSPKKISKIKKVVKKPKFEQYDSQKSKALKLSIQKMMQLPLSPLKLDLLFIELKKKIENKNDFCAREIKILITNIVKILEVYEQYEAAIRLMLVIPDFNGIERQLVHLVFKINNQKINKKQKVEQETLKFIESVLIYFCQNKKNRIYDLSSSDQIITSQLYGKNKQVFQNKLKESSEKQVDKKIFMDVSHINEVLKKQRQIVEKCLDYEQKYWDKFQEFLILKDGLFRKFD